MPASNAALPLAALVMAHGTSGVLEQLKHYNAAFHGSGLYMLLFDDRHFGDSDGQPRQLLSNPRQLQYDVAALDYIRKVPGVDPEPRRRLRQFSRRRRVLETSGARWMRGGGGFAGARDG